MKCIKVKITSCAWQNDRAWRPVCRSLQLHCLTGSLSAPLRKISRSDCFQWAPLPSVPRGDQSGYSARQNIHKGSCMFASFTRGISLAICCGETRTSLAQAVLVGKKKIHRMVWRPTEKWNNCYLQRSIWVIRAPVIPKSVFEHHQGG